MGNSGRFLPEGKPAARFSRATQTLIKLLSACRVFSRFRNPPNSWHGLQDLKRAFVDRSYACVYVHTGVGHTDSESAQF